MAAAAPPALPTPRLDKLHARLLRHAHASLGAVRQYMAAEATGAALVGSVINLASRLSLAAAAAAGGGAGSLPSPEAQRLLGPLLAFDGLAPRLAGRTAEELRRSAGRLGAVVELLREAAADARGAWREAQDAAARVGPPPLTPDEWAWRAPDRPLHAGGLLRLGEAAARFTAADLGHKLAAAAALTAAAAAAAEGEGLAAGPLDLGAPPAALGWEGALADARAHWDGPALRAARGGEGGRGDGGDDDGGGGSGEGAPPVRDALWVELCELAWLATGAPLVPRDDDSSDEGGEDEEDERGGGGGGDAAGDGAPG